LELLDKILRQSKEELEKYNEADQGNNKITLGDGLLKFVQWFNCYKNRKSQKN